MFPRRCHLERPLLVPLSSLVAGLVLADLLDIAIPSWPAVALLAVTFAACFVRSRFPFALSIAAFFMVWGVLSMKPFLRPADELAAFIRDRPVVVDGCVDARVEGATSGGSRIYLSVDRIGDDDREYAASGRLLVYVKSGRPKFFTGDRVRLSTRLRKPRSLGVPGEIDYARRLAYLGVFETGFVREADDMVLLRAGTGWRHGIDLLADRLGDFIMSAEPGPEGGVLKALLLGDRGDLSEPLQESFSRSGVNHILSISGFHVGVLFLTLFNGLYFLARRSEWLALHVRLRQTVLFTSLPVVLFYLFLSGAAPATQRSVLMIFAAVAALHLKRELDPVNTIMLAACAILFTAPETLFDVSFQLSFLAIWGLAVLAPPLSGLVAAKGRALRWTLLLFAASAAAILATFVHVAYYFRRVSLIGLVANLLVVPLMGYGAVVFGLLGLAASGVGDAPARLLLHLAALLVRWADRIVVCLSRAPVFEGYAPGRLDLLLACLALFVITFVHARPQRTAAATLLLFALILRAVPASSAPESAMRIYFLSVGQGDAALVHLPAGQWMLVDGGGNATDTEARVGPRVLVPALRALSVRRIDYLVLSHEHPDHLQGVAHLAAYFEVGQFLASPLLFRSPDAQQLKWILTARGVPVRPLEAEKAPLQLGGASLQPLWPLADGGESHTDANEASLVFRLSYGLSSVLFTGDIGADAERELLARHAVEPCSLLKVAHHGSRYSSTDSFLAAARPAAAVISAGYRNTFRLPAPATLLRLQRQGIRVYRTDQDGTIIAICMADGTLTIKTPLGHFN